MAFDSSFRAAAESSVSSDGNEARDTQSGERVISGTGLTADEMKAVVRRQLAGSIAAACLVAVVATLAAIRPAHHEIQYPSAHVFPVVKQPTLATTPNHRIAEAKGGTALP